MQPGQQIRRQSGEGASSGGERSEDEDELDWCQVTEETVVGAFSEIVTIDNKTLRILV